MKILVLQLARLGDIYMTWPVLRGLRRHYPDAEIHFLTRPRFEPAVEGLHAFDRHISIPTRNIMEPLVKADADTQESLARMSSFVTELKNENYDWVINFTFSPLSSYLTHAVSGPEAKVSGYTRFADGSFNPAGELVNYFFAQVGADRENRVHLADFFAAMVGVDFIEEDWGAPFLSATRADLPTNYITMHIGASESHKTLAPEQWARALMQVATRYPQTSVVLIGGTNEKPLAQKILRLVKNVKVVNWVGETSLKEIFTILAKTELLIGGDSAPIHMAALTDTPTLNVSVGRVNFWETGPKANLGFIYKATSADQVSPERLGEIINQLLAGQISKELITRCGGLVSFQREEKPADRFQWDLIQAIYMHEPYPLAERIEILQGAMKLGEINTFAQEQLRSISTRGLEKAAPFLERAEEVIDSISRFVPELCPLINWYHAEKVRIGPGTIEDIVAATLKIHERFAQHLRVYIPQDEKIAEGVGNGTF